jgi:hypothetical protein
MDIFIGEFITKQLAKELNDRIKYLEEYIQIVKNRS